MKKLIALVLALVFVLSLSISAFATVEILYGRKEYKEFRDHEDPDYHYEYEYLGNRKYRVTYYKYERDSLGGKHGHKSYVVLGQNSLTEEIVENIVNKTSTRRYKNQDVEDEDKDWKVWDKVHKRADKDDEKRTAPSTRVQAHSRDVSTEKDLKHAYVSTTPAKTNPGVTVAQGNIKMK